MLNPQCLLCLVLQSTSNLSSNRTLISQFPSKWDQRPAVLASCRLPWNRTSALSSLLSALSRFERVFHWTSSSVVLVATVLNTCLVRGIWVPTDHLGTAPQHTQTCFPLIPGSLNKKQCDLYYQYYLATLALHPRILSRFTWLPQNSLRAVNLSNLYIVSAKPLPCHTWEPPLAKMALNLNLVYVTRQDNQVPCSKI